MAVRSASIILRQAGGGKFNTTHWPCGILWGCGRSVGASEDNLQDLGNADGPHAAFGHSPFLDAV
jgi:hypothetical protein